MQRLSSMFMISTSLLGGCVVQLPGNLDAGATNSDGTDDSEGGPGGDGDPGDGDPGDGDGDSGDGDQGDGDQGDGDPGDGDQGDGDGDPLDMPVDTDEPTQGCGESGTCNAIDLLFVIDNSGTMGEEQLALPASLPSLLDALLALEDQQGNPLEPDVNIMFTTTDFGHPQCTPFQPDGYTPAQGAPRSQACIDRLDDFEGLGSNAPEFPQACTTFCPLAVEPDDPFIHMEGPMASTTNVPDNDVLGALQCLAPQGINGCGYESPLEAMMQAINPTAAWNQGNEPFLRDEAILAIVLMTDEEDCSVNAPEGHVYFTDQMQNTYWEINPETGTKTQATSAVCWNAGVECTGPDPDGVYEECHSIDSGVLHPLDRYLDYLRHDLIVDSDKRVVMLGLLGVPTQGGVDALVYRDWKDGPYPQGDLLPEAIADEETAASKQFEFGIGPGCTGTDGMGGFTGQAIPPVRIKEVCQGLDEDDLVRCSIASICGANYSGAFQSLAGMIQEAALPPN
jgi:hypothetical protein